MFSKLLLRLCILLLLSSCTFSSPLHESSESIQIFGAYTVCYTTSLGKLYYIVPAHCIDTRTLTDINQNIYTPLFTDIGEDVALMLGSYNHVLLDIDTSTDYNLYPKELPSGTGLYTDSGFSAMVLGHTQDHQSALFSMYNFTRWISLHQQSIGEYHVREILALIH